MKTLWHFTSLLNVHEALYMRRTKIWLYKCELLNPQPVSIQDFPRTAPAEAWLRGLFRQEQLLRNTVYSWSPKAITLQLSCWARWAGICVFYGLDVSYPEKPCVLKPWSSSSDGKWLSRQDSDLINKLIHVWILTVTGEQGTGHWRHVYEGILTFSPSVLLVPDMMFSHYSPGTTEPGELWTETSETVDHSRCSLKLFFQEHHHRNRWPSNRCCFLSSVDEAEDWEMLWSLSALVSANPKS